MNPKTTIGRCWVVRWVKGEGYPFTAGVLEVLPWRWPEDKVLDYLYGLYYNSPLRPLAERAEWAEGKAHLGLLVLKEPKRLIVGELPFVVANRVEDLCVSADEARGVERVTFTEPAGTYFDLEGEKVLRHHPATAVELELARAGVCAQPEPPQGEPKSG
jgi:hypothetical protein